MSEKATVYRFYINGYPPAVPPDTLGITFDKQGIDDLMKKLWPMIDYLNEKGKDGRRATIFIPGVGTSCLQSVLEAIAPAISKPLYEAEINDWLDKKENC